MLRAATIVALASAATAANTITAKDLTSFDAQAIEVLSQKLVDFQTSEAGKHAMVEGLYSPAENVLDDLARVHNHIAAVEEAQALNPNAQFGFTPYSMMSLEEFQAQIQMADAEELRNHIRENYEMASPEDIPEPTLDGKDWAGKCVGPVQQQGNCGSCWAFAATAALEGADCLVNGSLTKLSEQMITSCSTNGGSMGCKGGWPHHAMTYIAENGICTSAEYPYTSGSSGSTGSCKKDSCNARKLPISAGVQTGAGEDKLAGILNQQPVVVLVAAGNSAWQNYNGGVVDACPSGARMDHAVFATAYTGGYFKIRNSWGSSWGDSGYMKLKRGTGGDGTCLVASDPSYPKMTSGPNPPSPGPTPRPTPPRPTTPGPTPRPTPPSPGDCGSCNNCYYAPHSACFMGWTEAVCKQAGFTWCGM